MRTSSPEDRDRSERGTALLMVVGVLLVAGIFGLAFSASFQDLLGRTGRDRFAIAESQAAAAGLAKARVALAADPSWTGGEVSFGEGRATVKVEAIPDLPADRRVRISAVVHGPGPSGWTVGRRAVGVLRLGKGLPRVIAWNEAGGN